MDAHQHDQTREAKPKYTLSDYWNSGFGPPVQAKQLLAAGVGAGFLGPYVAQDYHDSLFCLRLAAVCYWVLVLWSCIPIRNVPVAPGRIQPWVRIVMIASIGGVPALAPFTTLLEPFREHPKALGLASFLYYLCAGVLLLVVWLLAAHERDKASTQAQSA